MQYFIAVEIGDSFDELFQKAFDFRKCEFDFVFEETCEIVFHILEDEEGGSS